MALRTELTFRGIPLSAAYIRVNRVFGGKREGWNSVVGVYASAEAAAANEPPLDEFNHSAAYVADANPLELIYLSLREKYIDSVDC